MRLIISICFLIFIGCAPPAEEPSKDNEGFRPPNKPNIGQCGPKSNLTLTSLEKSNAFEFDVYYDNYDVPHIRANSFEELSFASGYVFAEKNYCALQEQIILMKGESAQVFGPHKFSDSDEITEGDMFYLINDLFAQSFEFQKKSEYVFPKLSKATKISFNSYAKGINHFKQQKSPECGLETDIQGFDIYAYFLYKSALKNYKDHFIDMISDKLTNEALKLWQQDLKTPAYSVALGNKQIKDKKISTQLLSTTHAFYDSALREFEVHMIIPNQLNVYGVSEFGFPLPQIGFNNFVAWSHTPNHNMANHLLYKLTTRGNFYIFEDNPYLFKSSLIEVPYKTFGGGEDKWAVVLKSSHLGWVIEKEDESFAFKENLSSNIDMIEHWLRFALSTSVVDIRDSHRGYRGIPDQNTLAVDKHGKTLFINSSRVFDLNSVAQKNLTQDLILTASTTHLPKENNCSESLVPFDNVPDQFSRKNLRSVENLLVSKNNNYSSVYNPQQKLSQRVKTAQSLKIYNSLNPDEFLFSNIESQLYFQEKSNFYKVCKRLEKKQDLNPKFCQDLARWNGKFNGNSYLEIVVKEVFNSNISYKTAYSPSMPLTTPRNIIINEEFESALYMAFQQASNYDPANPLNENNIQGAGEELGTLNVATYKPHIFMNQKPLQLTGKSGLVVENESLYYPVNLGPSWMMSVEFKNNRPSARGLLVYGNQVSKFNSQSLGLYNSQKLRELEFFNSLEFEQRAYKSFKAE